MPRGQKLCSSCSEPAGPRAYSCLSCGKAFSFKKESTSIQAKTSVKKKEKVKQLISVNWRELKYGDHIFVKGGPYHSVKKNHEVVRQRMGYKGHYVVREIQAKGILAYSGKKEGFAFIYMGPEETSDDGIVHRRPHRLRLMKKTSKDDSK